MDAEDLLKQLSGNHLDKYSFLPKHMLQRQERRLAAAAAAAVTAANGSDQDEPPITPAAPTDSKASKSSKSRVAVNMRNDGPSTTSACRPNMRPQKTASVDGNFEMLCDRVRPRLRSHLIGNKKGTQSLERWLKACFENTCPQRILVLVGPPGCGKSSALRVLAEHCGFRLSSMDLSRPIAAKHIIRAVDTQERTLARDRRAKLVVLDGLESLHGEKGPQSILNEAFKPFVTWGRFRASQMRKKRTKPSARRKFTSSTTSTSTSTPMPMLTSAATPTHTQTAEQPTGVVIAYKHKRKTVGKTCSAPNTLICVVDSLPKFFNSDAFKYNKSLCNVVHFWPLKSEDLVAIYQRTMTHVGTQRTRTMSQQKTFKAFIDKCGGDARYMLNHLEISGIMITGAPDEAMLKQVPPRVGVGNVFESLKDAFFPVKQLSGLTIHQRKVEIERTPEHDDSNLLRLYYQQPVSLVSCVHANYLNVALRSKNAQQRKIDSLSDLADSLCDADLFDTRISRTQNYSTSEYVARLGFVEPTKFIRSFRTSPEEATMQLHMPSRIVSNSSMFKFEPTSDQRKLSMTCADFLAGDVFKGSTAAKRKRSGDVAESEASATNKKSKVKRPPSSRRTAPSKKSFYTINDAQQN
jgi:ABC-type dipeptide/oligopeptide/nickel transport system ATPase subunit